MFFDILKREDSILSGETEFYTMCIECEKKVRTEPETAISKARTAAEMFLKLVLEKNGIVIPADYDERKAAKLDKIVGMINLCLEKGFLEQRQTNGLHFARKDGNRVIHKTGEEVHEAAIVFRSLFIAVASYCTGEYITELFADEKRDAYTRKWDGKYIKEKPGYDTEDMLPIGDYEVIRPMFDYRSDMNETIRTYRCKRISVIAGEEEVQYAIIRRFDKYSTEDIRQYRDIVAMNEIKRNYANLEKTPIIAEEISISEDCKYRYLCYITAENTFLLSYKNSYEKFITSLKCETVSQRIGIQLKILKDIVEILYELIDIEEDKSIHHRNLSPACVFITPSRKGCRVSVGNFEYSKVTQKRNTTEYKATLMTSDYARRFQNDPYTAPEIKNFDEKLFVDPDWEQVDVYSAARISLYLIFGDPSDERLDSVQRNMSEEFFDITKAILTTEYPNRPSLKEYLRVIKAECLRFE